MSKNAKNQKNRKPGKNYMPKKKQKLEEKRETKHTAALEKSIFIILLVIVFYPVFVRGMYFETEQLWLEIMVFTLFALFWVCMRMKKEETFLRTPLDYAAIAFVAVYLLSLLAAVSLRLAVREWLKYCMYFSVFYMLSRLAYTHRRKMTALWVMFASGTGVCILGLDGPAGGGVSKALNKLFSGLGVDHNVFFGLYVDGRIHSTVQYPNALAGYLAMVFFVGMALVLLSKSQWLKTLAGGLLFLVPTVFVFTLSRGGYIVMAGALLLYLIVLPKGAKVRGAVYAVAPLAATAVVFIKMYGYIQNEVANRIWLAALAGIMLSALLTLLAHRVYPWFEKVNQKVYAAIFSSLAIIAIAGLIFALSSTGPITLENSGEENTWQTHVENFRLKPGDYVLEYEADARNDTDSAYAYNIRIYSRNTANILGSGSTQLKSVSEDATQGVEKRTVEFTVPEDSAVTNIQFRNYYPGTSVTVNSARVTDTIADNTVKRLTLSYKHLPQAVTGVVERFKDLFSSSSNISRQVFYGDGFRMLGDRLMLGAGGGAWSLLYFSYQSYPYWSSLTHNFWLQTAIETGIPGILAMLFLLGGFVYMFVKQAGSKKERKQEERILQAVLFTAVAAILAHATMDFDLSLAGIALAMWQLLALFNAGHGDEKAFKTVKLKPVLIAVVAACLVVLPATQKYAETCSHKSLDTYNQGDIDEGIALMEKAYGADPIKAHYKLDYANMVTQRTHTVDVLEKAMLLAVDAEQQSMYDADMLLKIGTFYLRNRNIDGAIEAVNKSVEIRPMWEGSWYQKATVHYHASIQAFNRQDREAAEKMLDAVLAIPGEAREVNERNLTPFTFEPRTSEVIERCAYVREHIDSGMTISLDDISFYSKPYMDIDSDGVLDGWRAGNDNVIISFDEDTLTVENTGENSSYVYSRDLNLLAGRTYNIEIEMAGQPPEELRYRLVGIQEGWQKAEMKDGVFTGSFETPETTDGRYYLMIRVTDSIQIESVLVMAEEEQ